MPCAKAPRPIPKLARLILLILRRRLRSRAACPMSWAARRPSARYPSRPPPAACPARSRASDRCRWPAGCRRQASSCSWPDCSSACRSACRRPCPARNRPAPCSCQASRQRVLLAGQLVDLLVQLLHGLHGHADGVLERDHGAVTDAGGRLEVLGIGADVLAGIGHAVLVFPL